MKNETGATFFLVDEIALPDESKAATAPSELIEAAQKSGARRKFLARGEGGFHSQHSEFPAGFEVAPQPRPRRDDRRRGRHPDDARWGADARVG